MAKRSKPLLIALVSVTILALAGIGVLVWPALIATRDDGDAAANADPSGTVEQVRGVWLLDPETGEAELVPNSNSLRLAQWLEDGQTFVAQQGPPGGSWGLYDMDGKLLTTVVEQRAPEDVGTTIHVQPLPGDGETILLRYRDEENQAETWRLLDLTTGNEQPLPVFLRDASGLVYSPDGKKVVYANSDGSGWSLIVANADGTEIGAVASLEEGGSPGYPVWSPDSSQLLVYSGVAWRVIDLDGNERWAGPSERGVYGIWVGPERLALLRPGIQAEGAVRIASAEIVDLEDGSSREISVEELATTPPTPFVSPDGTYMISQRRNESGDYTGSIVRFDSDGNVSGTSQVPPKVDLYMGVDWTADSSLALLSAL